VLVAVVKNFSTLLTRDAAESMPCSRSVIFLAHHVHETRKVVTLMTAVYISSCYS